MKFAEHLGAHITPEWRKQYVQYEGMKDMIYQAVEEAPSPEVTDTEIIQAHFARFDETFFQFCDRELLKINTFFSEKLSHASRKYGTLVTELDTHEQQAQQMTSSSVLRKRRMSAAPNAPLIKQYQQLTDQQGSVKKKETTAMNTRKMHDIKLAFSEFYLSLILLQNYQNLNFTGFRKILKKHDKLLETDRGAKWRQANVETAMFYTTKDVDHLIKKTEGVFTQRLESGNRQKAMKRLRVPPLGEKQNPWTTFRVGFFSGVFLVLVSVAIFSAFFTRSTHHQDWEAALRMYRGVFLVLLCMFLLGINTYGWRSSGVNHVLIFELDPRDHLTHQELLELAGSFAVIWALSLLSYLFSFYLHVPVFANPLCLIVFCAIFLLNPIKILNYKARMWLLRILFRIITAPFHHVGFADFWLADQLNSLQTVLLDVEYLICFYALEVDWLPHSDERQGVCGGVSYGIRPIVACLPAWWRFAQCLRRYRDTRLLFPHIVNAGKYSTTFFVVLFSSLNSAYKDEHGEAVRQNNAFFYLWVIAAFLSTCYTFTWDIKMDWGLLDKNAGENRFLREEMVYAYKGYYYFAMVNDFILRFSWTISISLAEGGFIHKEILKTMLASLEVFRRFIWNFFRLENEHLNNCGAFRAVRDISIVPMDSNDQALLQEMMDNEDGVSNRTCNEKQKLLPSSHVQWGRVVDDTVLVTLMGFPTLSPGEPTLPLLTPKAARRKSRLRRKSSKKDVKLFLGGALGKEESSIRRSLLMIGHGNSASDPDN